MSRSLAAEDVPQHLRNKLRISAAQPAELVAQLRGEGWKRAYIDGGAVIRAFLQAGLIQELTLTRVPVLLGSGRPLFGGLESDLRLHCVTSRQYPDGLVSTRYRVEGSRPDE
ncbi:dihydrofolate reductase family protein [Pseudomonas idahonensis]|uniref:dihydrofolate reductase family protein n=1 Tax=Pseudomonas idahonensis TaxID=2942628 RepID=UPI0030D0AF4C